MRACIVVLLVVLASAMGAAQALYPRDAPREPGAPRWARERAALPAFAPPRMPDGTPDLRGRWAGTPGGDDIEEHDYVDVSSPPEETFIDDPPGGTLPYHPWALAARNAHRAGLARGWPGETGERLYADPQTYCLYSVPRATYRGGFDIQQGPGYVLMQFNFGHGAGAHVIERFTLVSANILDYQVTIDDPQVFTRPWTIRLPIRRAAAPGNDRYASELWEHACHEGNKSGEEMRELGFRWFRNTARP